MTRLEYAVGPQRRQVDPARRPPAKDDGSSPASRSPQQARMEGSELWDLTTDELGGTETMRAAGDRWLPMEAAEEPRAYRARLRRTIHYAALRDTIKKLTSRPFSRAVSIVEPEKLPQELAPIAGDADLEGSCLTDFLERVLSDALARGLTHVFVDNSQSSDEAAADGAPASAADDIARAVRPYFQHVPAADLIATKSVRLSGGRRVLTEARFYERVTEEFGEFGQREVTQIRALYAPELDERTGEPVAGEDGLPASPGRWEVWRWDAKRGRWHVPPGMSGTHTYPGVPLETYYTKRVGHVEGESPLADLTWLALLHYQTGSDQRNILRFARVPILKMLGLTPDEMKKRVTIGPTQAIKSTNAEAQIGWCELTGKSIEYGQADQLHIEEMMQVLGLSPLVNQQANQTATGVSADEGRNLSPIQQWIRGLEEFGMRVYACAARWVGADAAARFKAAIDAGMKLDIYSDFITLSQASGLAELLQACLNGKLPTRQFLAECQRRGLLDERANPQELADEAANEAGEAQQRAMKVAQSAAEMDAEAAKARAAADGEDGEY